MSDALGDIGRPEDLLVMCGDVPITREKIRCLQPLPWLGSEVIDAYLSMLSMDPSRSSARTLIMNSRLFTQLTGGGKHGNGQYDYKRVARWTERAQIGGAILEDFDKLMIPVNLHDTHWALCVVNCTSSQQRIVPKHVTLGLRTESLLALHWKMTAFLFQILCHWQQMVHL